ncbi:MAG: bactofilin family protein [Chloroflexota bacterium]
MLGGTFDQQGDTAPEGEAPEYMADAAAGFDLQAGGAASGDAPMPSYLNAATYFKGLLRSERSIGIDGHFEGEIQSQADIVVGPEAEVRANIKATNVIVSGKVMGHVTCGTLEIQSTGKVVGNIAAGSLLIALGAVFRGQSLMGEEDEASAGLAFSSANNNHHDRAAASEGLEPLDVTDPIAQDVNDIEPA